MSQDEHLRDDVMVALMPEPYFQLRLEIEKHPALVQIFQAGQGADTPFDEVLAHTAAYCEVILNGYFTQEDLLKLAETLREKLVQKRSTVLWLPPSASQH